MVDGLDTAYGGDISASPSEKILQRLGMAERALDKIAHTGSTWAKVIVLVGDSGMGKTYTANTFLELLERDGVYTKSVSLAHEEGEGVTRKLRLLARGLTSDMGTQSRAVLLLDDVPATDECDIDKQLRCIKRFTRAKALVIMCVRPECVQLAEEIPNARFLWPEDLVIPCEDIASGHLLASTNGVPALVAAYREEPLRCSWESDDVRVARRAERIIRECLRDTLPLEEQHMRLAMMLLGSGSFEDLGLVVERCSQDTIAWLAHDAPFFGISLTQNCFRVAFLATLEGLRVRIATMQAAAFAYPSVVMKCALLLARRGEYGRSALVGSLQEAAGAAELVREWGIEYLCAGEEAFVGRVLSSQAWQDYCDDDRANEVVRAYALLVGPAQSTEPLVRNSSENASASPQTRLRWRHLELLQATRDLDCGLATPRVAHERADDDSLALELALHVRVRTLLLRGHVADAYQLLVNSPLKNGSETLAQLLLSDDYLIAQVLSGEELTERELAHVIEVRERMAAFSEGRLSRYRSHLEQLLLVLAGRHNYLDGIEALISYADKMGDSALSAVFLMVAAIADNRLKAYTRAHVRSLQAAARVSGTFGGLVGRRSRLIAGLAAYMLEDSGELVLLASEPPDSMEKDLAAFFCGKKLLGEKPRPTVLLTSASSNDMTWALNMLCNDFGDLSDAFRQEIPPAWNAASRRMVRKAEAFSRSMERELWRQDPAKRFGPTLPAESARHGARVELSLLGEPLIKVDGKEVDAQRLEKRRAKSLLVYLASRKDHRATKYEIIESIWSECDFESGRQRIYEATYAIRAALGLKQSNLDLFSTARGKATIALNCDVISSDIDTFERKAKAALAHDGNEERVIALVCDAMELYRGDLCDELYDALNLVAARRAELRDLFVDLSITGARLAIKEGRMSLATRLACKGYEVSPTREDIVLVYVEALKTTGRYHDAREVYQHYSYAVVEATGMPPTKALRDAASDLMPSYHGRKSQRKAVNSLTA